MKKIRAKQVIAEGLIDDFIIKSDDYKNRYSSILGQMEHFIKESNLGEDVFVNPILVGLALIDCFEDIRRLKDFHKIESTNGLKIVSYTAYWLLRRKPIQVKSVKEENAYINEYFVLLYIFNYVSSEKLGFILDRKEEGLISFKDTLLYNLKYRINDPKSLELMITGFFAGQIYQSVEKDLSDELPPRD